MRSSKLTGTFSQVSTGSSEQESSIRKISETTSSGLTTNTVTYSKSTGSSEIFSESTGSEAGTRLLIT